MSKKSSALDKMTPNASGKKKTCGSLCSLLLAKCDKCGETENSESLELMHMCMGNQQRRTLRFTFNCQKQLGKKLPHRTL